MESPWDMESEYLSHFNEKMELKFMNSLNSILALMDEKVFERINNFFQKKFLISPLEEAKKFLIFLRIYSENVKRPSLIESKTLNFFLQKSFSKGSNSYFNRYPITLISSIRHLMLVGDILHLFSIKSKAFLNNTIKEIGETLLEMKKSVKIDKKIIYLLKNITHAIKITEFKMKAIDFEMSEIVKQKKFLLDKTSLEATETAKRLVKIIQELQKNPSKGKPVKFSDRLIDFLSIFNIKPVELTKDHLKIFQQRVVREHLKIFKLLSFFKTNFNFSDFNGNFLKTNGDFFFYNSFFFKKFFAKFLKFNDFNFINKVFKYLSGVKHYKFVNAEIDFFKSFFISKPNSTELSSTLLSSFSKYNEFS